MYGIFCIPVGYLEVGDRVVVVVVMRSGQRCLLRCGAATQTASTSTLNAGPPSGDELARTDMVQLPSGDGGSSLARDEKQGG